MLSRIIRNIIRHIGGIFIASNQNDIRTWSLKLIIIGMPSVGKTSLRRAYLGEKFRVNYIATIGADFSFKQIDLGPDQINTSIWDLAGQEETFANIHPQYYKGSAGALVVFDVNNRETFDSVESWISKYQSLTGEQKCPILIVGNKIDILDDDGVSEEEQNQKVEAIRKKYKDEFPILSSRTSAKTGNAINESFRLLVSEIVDWQKNELSIIKEPTQKDMSKYLPISYLLTFHDMFGPKILSRSSSIEKIEQDKEFASAIKISSILDFDDVIKFAQVTGATPWTSPEGMFYYIAFTVDNANARGGKSLFIVGFVVVREMREIISQIQNIVDGTLHSAMNEVVRILVANKADLTSEQSTDLSEEVEKQVSDIILELREKVFEIIKNKV